MANSIKIAKRVIICIVCTILLLLTGSLIINRIGLVYSAQKVYELVSDFNLDGKTETLRYPNHYYLFNNPIVTDSYHTLNDIRIYMNGKKIYHGKIDSFGALISPEIIDTTEGRHQGPGITIHDSGGGPAPPMDYIFEIDGENAVLSRSRSD